MHACNGELRLINPLGGFEVGQTGRDAWKANKVDGRLCMMTMPTLSGWTGRDGQSGTVVALETSLRRQVQVVNRGQTRLIDKSSPLYFS